MVPDDSEHIAKGGSVFAIPGRGAATGTRPSGWNACPKRATRLKRPKSKGVERSRARSDHWRCVSMPRWARLSSKVTRHSPALHKVLDDLLCQLVWVGGKEGF